MNPLLAAAIVDWSALGQVIYLSLLAGIGIGIAFSLVVVGATRASETRRAGRTATAAAYSALAAAGAAVTIAAVAIGLLYMVRK